MVLILRSAPRGASRRTQGAVAAHAAIWPGSLSTGIRPCSINSGAVPGIGPLRMAISGAGPRICRSAIPSSRVATKNMPAAGPRQRPRHRRGAEPIGIRLDDRGAPRRRRLRASAGANSRRSRPGRFRESRRHGKPGLTSCVLPYGPRASRPHSTINASNRRSAAARGRSDCRTSWSPPRNAA